MSRPGLFYKQSSRKALGFLVPWVPVGARGCPWEVDFVTGQL